MFGRNHVSMSAADFMSFAVKVILCLIDPSIKRGRGLHNRSHTMVYAVVDVSGLVNESAGIRFRVIGMQLSYKSFVIRIVAVEANKVNIFGAARQFFLNVYIAFIWNKPDVPWELFVFFKRIFNQILAGFRISNQGRELLAGLFFETLQGVFHKDGHSIFNPRFRQAQRPAIAFRPAIEFGFDEDCRASQMLSLLIAVRSYEIFQYGVHFRWFLFERVQHQHFLIDLVAFVKNNHIIAFFLFVRISCGY